MATTTSTVSDTKQLIHYRVEGGVAVIEMFDPQANTYTYEMNRQLDEAILKARFDNEVYVLMLTGSGDKFFSAGANIKMLNSVDPVFKYYFCLHANETLLRLEHTPKLVIAAINGHCVGGGLEIAMAADIRIARKDAGKVGLPEVNLGVRPGTGGTQRLSRLVGKSKAIELMVTGNTFTFEEAKEMGIVNYIFEHDAWFKEYVRHYTNGPVIIKPDYQDPEDTGGFFSGWNPEHSAYGISTWTVDELIASGQVTAHRLGRRVLVDAEYMRRWYEQLDEA